MTAADRRARSSDRFRSGTIRRSGRSSSRPLLWWFWYSLAFEIVRNTADNLRSHNQDLSINFLWRTAGFDIIQTLVPYSSSSNYGRALYVGFLNTILVSVMSHCRGHHHRLHHRPHAAFQELARLAHRHGLHRSLPQCAVAAVDFHDLQRHPSTFAGPQETPTVCSGTILPLQEGLDDASAGFRRWRMAWPYRPHGGNRRVDRRCGAGQGSGKKQTGQPFPIFWASAALIVLLPLLGLAAGGISTDLGLSHQDLFQFQRRRNGHARTHRHVPGALDLSRHLYRRGGESRRAGGEPWANRGCPCAWDFVAAWR